MGKADVRTFLRMGSRVADFLKDRIEQKRSVKIVAHRDTDGIAATMILAECLRFYDVPFSIEFSRPKKPAEIAELGQEEYELFVFLDQGSAQLEAIHKSLLAKHRDVIIIDHHPGEFHEHPNLAVLNPHSIGMNGAKDVSGSSAAYVVVENLDPRFRSLIVVALIGAIGDRQEFFSGFTGVNDVLYKRAVDLGFVETREGLRLVGRSFRPLVETLRLSIRPFIKGLSGHPTVCQQVLEELDLKPSTMLSQLDMEEEKALADLLVARAGEAAKAEEFRHTLWGSIHQPVAGFHLLSLTFRECSALLDACGSLNKPEIGLSALIGDRTALHEATSLLTTYHEEMLRALEYLVNRLGSVRERQNLRVLDGGDGVRPALVGEAVSLLIESGLVRMDKPIVIFSKTPTGEIKVSARSTPALAMGGLDLGAAIKAAAERAGGVGGGHDVAAAARIPPSEIEEFLSLLDKSLEGSHEVSATD